MSDPTSKTDDTGDLFSVEPFHTGTTIPPLSDIPLTPEERRRRIAIRVAIVLALVLATVTAIWLLLRYQHVRAVAEAEALATKSGRVADIRRALGLLAADRGEAAAAQRLYLRALLVAAGAEPADERLLAVAGEGGDDPAEPRVDMARTYLHLAAGNLSGAMQTASRLVPQGADAAEAARVRALAAQAIGNVPQALASARTAAERSPHSSRHVALVAELLARSGEPQQALARLDALPAEHRGPADQLARARVLDMRGNTPAVAAELAGKVRADNASTPYERAWARLLLGRSAARRGDRVAARSHLSAAAEVAPSGDELFTLGLTEAALQIRAPRLAAAAATRLPTPLSVDAGRRAQLAAELALFRNDLEAARAALARAPAGPRTDLLQGWLLTRTQRFDAARQRLRAARQSPALEVVATLRWAELELADDRPEAAVRLLEPQLRKTDHHPDLIPTAVDAYLATAAAPRALEVVRPAVASHPEDARLLQARAKVERALERWETARATLGRAVELEGDEPDYHADLGAVHRHLGQLSVARTAFARALELNARHRGALLGTLELDLTEFRLPEALATLRRVDAAGVRSLERDRLEARVLLMDLAGKEGLSVVRAALRRHRRDPELTLALGWFHMQAENFPNAVWTFTRFTGRDVERDLRVRAVIGRALAQTRLRAGQPATTLLEELLGDHPLDQLSEPLRAAALALQARLALIDHRRGLARRLTRHALRLDPKQTEAHLVTADLATAQEQDPSPALRAALIGVHPPARPLAQLALRSEEVSDESCQYIERYRRAAPNGQFARGAARLRRSCRQR